MMLRGYVAEAAVFGNFRPKQHGVGMNNYLELFATACVLRQYRRGNSVVLRRG